MRPEKEGEARGHHQPVIIKLESVVNGLPEAGRLSLPMTPDHPDKAQLSSGFHINRGRRKGKTNP